jgi:cytochrome b subunit of formate dehydrogenase
MSPRPDDVVRFDTRQRVEHAAVILLFAVLALTGFPQKFPDSRWAPLLAGAVGGIGSARFLHRAAGVLFAVLAVSHLAAAALGALRGRIPLSMVPTRKDFADAAGMLRFYLGTAPHAPRFDRFDYREKFEYWGLVFGALIMTGTGFVLLFPLAFSRVLDGALIPVAKIAHSQEGLMAFLVVITWHVYNAHLAPEVFPFNPTIFTGRIGHARLRRDHPLEYDRLFGGAPEASAATGAKALLLAPLKAGALALFLPAAGFALVAEAVGKGAARRLRGRATSPADRA